MVSVDDPSNDVKTEAQALIAACVSSPVKRVKKLWNLGIGDLRAGIGDGDLQMRHHLRRSALERPVGRLRLDFDGSALGAVLDRVQKQVLEDLHHSVPIE